MSFIHSANTLSFDLHSFNNRDLLFQGDALLTDQRDGLSFFLVPNDSSIPSNSNGGDPIEKTGTQFVAVEFDPRTEHVGIYINSFQPVKGVEWHCTEKENFNAVVNYCAARNFCVLFIDHVDNSTLTGNSTLCKVVDLREYLPEWVSVGFSASSRELSQTYTIFSWKFYSSSIEDTLTKENEDKGKKRALVGVRYKIALGLASALLYLHEEWEQCVVHRDIKSSNVMLDTNFKAKLGDFGLARLIDHELGPKTTGPAGTMGYIAPEYISTGKASKESDMYSFGIVALEIACGRRAIEPDIDESQVRLVAWVWELYGNGNLLDAVDQKLCGAIDVKQMERLLIVGLWCAHPDHNLRPSIRQAAQVLNFEAGVPDLPMKMPVAMYQVPDYASTSSSTKALMTFTSFNVGR
ncbi:hypothetical protein GH714_033908 [Hevea brasiliensis]|uniref:Protein kinase domain-containing protein n=1 Tax=Hevea brasiliensis TaxID=3981 RepID=A0A6A6L661_HEVBR|nr:hypothetical protein GH714_033908 [Hevea brasiliensis]